MNYIQTKTTSPTQGTCNTSIDNTVLNVGYFYLNRELKLYPKLNEPPYNIHVWGKICSAVCNIAMNLIEKYEVMNITVCLIDMKAEKTGRIFIEKFRNKHKFDTDKVKFVQWKPTLKIVPNN